MLPNAVGRRVLGLNGLSDASLFGLMMDQETPRPKAGQLSKYRGRLVLDACRPSAYFRAATWLRVWPRLRAALTLVGCFAVN